MRQGFIHTCFVLFLLLPQLTGCGGGGSATEENFKKIKLGMSEAEVVAILGKPDTAMTHPQQRSLRFIEWDKDSRVAFENNKVFAVVYKDQTILEEAQPELLLEEE